MGTERSGSSTILLAAPYILCEDVKQRLTSDARFSVLPRCAMARQDLLELICLHAPDVLMLDMHLTGPDPAAVFAELEGLIRPPHVVALAAHHHCLAYAQQFRITRGTLLRRMLFSPVLGPALEGIASGLIFYAPPNRDTNPFELTRYQFNLLELMAVGLGTQHLAAALGRSVNSIYAAQVEIRRKLGVGTNVQAILVAIQHGIVGLLLKPESQVTSERVA